MKSQTEPIIFVLLLLIILIIVSTSAIWSRDIIKNNIDAGRLNQAEQFMIKLDSTIQNIAKNGGIEKVDFPLDADIYILDNCTNSFPIELDNCIQLEQETSLSLSEKWIYFNTINSNKHGNFNDTISIIREKQEGKILKIQIYYRIRGDYNYTINLEKQGYTVRPLYILIENNGTEMKTFLGKKYLVSKIKINFI